MEKLKIGNLEFSLTPMGANHDTYNKHRKFDIITDLNYTELEDFLLEDDNLKVIQYFSAGGEVLATYTDCVALKSITKERAKFLTEDSVLRDVFTITLSTDATITRFRALEEENTLLKQDVNQLKEQNEMLTGCILELSELICL